MNGSVEEFDEMPHFGFEPPRGYFFLLQRGLIGFMGTSSRLHPWHYIPKKWGGRAYDRNRPGPYKGKGDLFPFARRIDTDDIACFEVVNARVERVFSIHGWTADGYEIMASYTSFFEWVKSVIDDIAVIVNTE